MVDSTVPHKSFISSVIKIISIFFPTGFRNRLLDRQRCCPFSGATAWRTRWQTHIHHHLDPNSRIQQRARTRWQLQGLVSIRMFSEKAKSINHKRIRFPMTKYPNPLLPLSHTQIQNWQQHRFARNRLHQGHYWGETRRYPSTKRPILVRGPRRYPHQCIIHRWWEWFPCNRRPYPNSTTSASWHPSRIGPDLRRYPHQQGEGRR